MENKDSTQYSAKLLIFLIKKKLKLIDSKEKKVILKKLENTKNYPLSEPPNLKLKMYRNFMKVGRVFLQ